MNAAFSTDALAAVLPSSWQRQAFVLAYSGGLDSTVLLHAMASLRSRAPNLKLRALHVHHGLASQADSWMSHCRQVCAALHLECRCVHVDARPRSGESPEAAARRARYRAFAEQLQAGEVLLLAHQADDQLETMLLRLMRGVGTLGLAGMPARRKLARGTLERPLLGWPRQALLDFARHHGLVWIEDPSNRNTRIDRNHLRHLVVPALRQRWPRAATLAARSAMQLGEEAGLLRELAMLDLGEAFTRAVLPVARIGALDMPRRRNALRHALLARGLPPPPRARLEEALRQIEQARADRGVLVQWRGGELRREGEWLWMLESLPQPAAGRQPLTVNTPVRDAQGELRLLAWPPSADSGRYCTVTEADLAAGLSVGYRSGGERLRTARDRHIALKRVLHDQRVPAWLRPRLPLVFAGEELIAVADWYPARRCGEQAPRWIIDWMPAPALLPGVEWLPGRAKPG